MSRVRGVRRTAVGFAIAMAVMSALVWLDPASKLPGIDPAVPREIPVAVVGPQPDAQTMRTALNALAGHPIAVRGSTSLGSARRMLHERTVSGVIVMAETGPHRLIVASADSQKTADRVEQVVTDSLALSAQRVRVTDAVPAPANDPNGLAAFQLSSAWVGLGMIFAALLGLVFGARSAGHRLVMLRFVGLLAGAVIAGLGGAALASLGATGLDGPVLATGAFGTLLVTAVGAVTLALMAWFGWSGLAVSGLFFVVLGIPGALGAWPLTSWSSAWPTMLAWLPPGAGAWALRGIAYFGGAGIDRVVALLAIWVVLGLAASLIAATDHDEDPRMRRFHPQLRRHPVYSAIGGLAAVALLLVAPAASSFNRTDLTPALTVSCEPFPAPASVDELNRQITDFRATSGFVGGDVGASAQTSDDRSLFVFGDTVRTPGYGNQSMVRNSMLVFDGVCGGSVERRDKGAVIPDRSSKVGYWPMSIASVNIHGHDLVGVMAQRVTQTGSELFDFENLGPAIAIFRVDPGRPPVLQRVADLGPDNPSTEHPTWGAASEVEDGTVYLYGTHRTSDAGAGWAVSVARARIEKIADQSTWRYWDGSRWQPNADRAATVIDQLDGVSQTFSVFREGKTWYALSKRADFLGTDLVVWTSPSPTGPFTAQPALAKIPSTDSELRYMPLAHPELMAEPGTMVVSVSRNTSDSAKIQKDPSLYRPEFMRVVLPQ